MYFYTSFIEKLQSFIISHYEPSANWRDAIYPPFMGWATDKITRRFIGLLKSILEAYEMAEEKKKDEAKDEEKVEVTEEKGKKKEKKKGRRADAGDAAERPPRGSRRSSRGEEDEEFRYHRVR